MESQIALQRLSEAREVLDGETAEMVDTLARVVMLQQDIRSPMLGAKVTLWLRPRHTDYSDAKVVDQEDAPAPGSEDWNWQWSMVGGETDPEIKFQAKEDPDDPDLIPHKAIVIEGNVSESGPEGELWDPNEKEYKTADEYPMGTVNCVVAKDHFDKYLEDFEEDYATNVEVYTSVMPADGDPSPLQYTPGWLD